MKIDSEEEAIFIAERKEWGVRSVSKLNRPIQLSAVGAGFTCPKTQSKPFSGEQTSLLRTKQQHYPRFDTPPTLIKKVDQSCRKETCIANCSCSILSYWNAKSVFFVNCLPIPHIKFIPLHF